MIGSEATIGRLEMLPIVPGIQNHPRLDEDMAMEREPPGLESRAQVAPCPPKTTFQDFETSRIVMARRGGMAICRRRHRRPKQRPSSPETDLQADIDAPHGRVLSACPNHPRDARCIGRKQDIGATMSANGRYPQAVRGILLCRGSSNRMRTSGPAPAKIVSAGVTP